MCLSISSFTALIVSISSLSQLAPRFVIDLLGARSDRGGWSIPQFAPVSSWTFPNEIRARSGWEFELLLACLVAPILFNALILFHHKRKALFFENCHYFFDEFETGILGKVFWTFTGFLNVENVNWVYRWCFDSDSFDRSTDGSPDFRRQFVFYSAALDLFNFLALVCLTVRFTSICIISMLYFISAF